MSEEEPVVETPPAEEPDEDTPPAAEVPLDRGGADGKAKALGTPGLGEYGRPSRRNDAGVLSNEVSNQEDR